MAENPYPTIPAKARPIKSVRQFCDVTVRLPLNLRSQLERAAHVNKRVLSAELRSRLEWSFARNKCLAEELINMFPKSTDIEYIAAWLKEYLERLEHG
jgi:hypothetical protein